MAKKSEVQYIRYYTVGSAARQLVPQITQQPKTAPRPRKAKKIVICIDPVAILGIMTAVIMMICLLVGVTRLNQVWTQQEQLAHHVQQMVAENASLYQQYESGYDLEEIEKTALALGMVPAQQVEHIAIGD